MSVQDTRMASSSIPQVRNEAGKNAAGELSPDLALFASAALTLMLVLAFLYLDVSFAVAVPLAVLVGLTSRHLFGLIFRATRNDLFFPTTLVVCYFVVDFAARSYYLATVPFFARIGRNPYDDYLPAALWCACAGYVAYSSGMGSKAAGRWLRGVPRPGNWPRSLPALRLLLLMIVGLGCLIYLFKLGMTVGNYGNLEFQRHPPPGLPVLLENLTDLSWVAVCVFLATSARKSRPGVIWLLLGVSVGILCLKLAISGGKVALLQPFLETAIVFHYGKRRFRIWEMVTIGVPVVMLAFGVVNFYRFVVVGQHGAPKDLADVVSRVSSATDMLNDAHGTGSQQSALEQMVDRNAGTDALALIMRYTPNPFPYVYGRHWLEIPLTFIPRQIWKNKPVNMPSAEFESTYMSEPSNYNGFSSMHLIGDLYRNFSFAGVLFGMFLLGVLLRFFYLFCSPCRENGAGLFLYAALFPEIIHSLESDVGYAMINVFRAAVLALGVAYFLGARFKKVRRVDSPRRILSGAEVSHCDYGIASEAQAE
jgi:hypothetical protein